MDRGEKPAVNEMKNVVMFSLQQQQCTVTKVMCS